MFFDRMFISQSYLNQVHCDPRGLPTALIGNKRQTSWHHHTDGNVQQHKLFLAENDKTIFKWFQGSPIALNRSLEEGAHPKICLLDKVLKSPQKLRIIMVSSMFFYSKEIKEVVFQCPYFWVNRYILRGPSSEPSLKSRCTKLHEAHQLLTSRTKLQSAISTGRWTSTKRSARSEASKKSSQGAEKNYWKWLDSSSLPET